MKRISISLTAVVIALSMWLPAQTRSAIASQPMVRGASPSAKKVCKAVTKKVHGKKKVKVCKTVKPSPGPSIPSGPGAASPLTVGITLDGGHAVTQAVTSSAGGVIATTGADGSKYILTIPPGALQADTTITMTPLASMSNLPPGATLAAGVDLQPEGLLFARVAQLEIQPARVVPVAQQMATEYYGSGSDFHMEPLALDTTKIIFPLYHFSGRPMLDARPALQTYMYKHPPSAVSDRYAQIMAGDVSLFRSGQLSQADFLTRAVALVKRLIETVAIPDAQAGLSDDAALARAFADYLWVERNAEMWNLAGEVSDQLKTLFDLLVQGLDNAFDRAANRCNTHQPRVLMNDSQVGWTIDREDIVSVLSAARQAQLLDITSADAHMNYAIASCRPRGFHFSLKMSWDAVSIPPATPGMTAHQDWMIGGQICGDDPYAGNGVNGGYTNPWNVTLTARAKETSYDGQVYTETNTTTQQWFLQADNHFSSTNLGQFNAEGESDARFDKGPPPEVSLHVVPPPVNWSWTPPEQTVTATVEEDMTCPAPKPPGS